MTDTYREFDDFDWSKKVGQSGCSYSQFYTYVMFLIESSRSCKSDCCQLITLARQHNFKFNELLLTHAVKFGNIHSVIFISSTVKFNDHMALMACKYNRIDVIIYMSVSLFEFEKTICRHAIRFGNLVILKFLVSNGLMIDDICCHMASSLGHHNIVKYLLDIFDKIVIGSDKDADDVKNSMMEMAVSNGHIECVKHLYDSGCSFNRQLLQIAINKGHKNCIDFIEQFSDHDNCFDCYTCARS